MLQFFKNFSVISKLHSSQRSFASRVTTGAAEPGMTSKNFNQLDRDKRIKILELEISLLHQAGRKAPDPSKIKPETWELILSLPTKSAREREYEFLWLNEQKKNSDAAKKERKKAENKLRFEQKRIEIEENKHIQYGLRFNTLFLKIRDKTINQHRNNRLIKAMMFEQKLIFDCSYDDYMSPKEAKNAADQLRRSFADNRLHPEPFDLHFCNFNLNSIASKVLHKFIPTMLEPAFPMNIHSESLTEKFEKDRLVYLTPHCNNELLEYSHDDIYIIGAMVDKSGQGPLSLAKAKKQGLRMAKLPLDRYLSWKTSGKSLAMDQMVNIMLDMKKFGDWNRALRFVPKRKITEYPTKPSFMKRDSIKQHENLNGFVTSSEPLRISYEKSENIQRLQTYEPRTSFSYKKGGVDKDRKKFKISELDLSFDEDRKQD